MDVRKVNSIIPKKIFDNSTGKIENYIRTHFDERVDSCSDMSSDYLILNGAIDNKF